MSTTNTHEERAYRVIVSQPGYLPESEPYTVLGLDAARDAARDEITHGDAPPVAGNGPAAVDAEILADGGRLELAGGYVLEVVPTDILPDDVTIAEGGDAGDVIELTGTLADDIDVAVKVDHPCRDDETCDIYNAREAGYPFSAAELLSGATETPALDAVLGAYAACGILTNDPRRGDVPAGDAEGWHEHFERYARMCDDCGGATFAGDHWEPEECSHCRSDFAAQRTRRVLDGAPWHGTLTVETIDHWEETHTHTGRIVARSRDADTFTLDTGDGRERTFRVDDIDGAELLDAGERTEPLDI
jgi:hypothetical protein